MLKKENECYDKLSLLNDSQENIIAVNKKVDFLTVMTCKVNYSDVMLAKSIDYSIYKVFDNTVSIDFSCRIAAASLIKGKNYSAHIDSVAVSEQEQGKGYGTLIINQIINDAHYYGINYLIGDIYSQDINTPKKLARFDHFYKKLGFYVDYEKSKLFREIQ